MNAAATRSGSHDPPDLDGLAEAFVTASRALVAIATRSIASSPTEITIPQHRVLVLLATVGPHSVGQIATQLGVNPSNATRVCDRLQRLELIARARSTQDGRSVSVTITRAGRRIVQHIARQRHREVAKVLDAMSVADGRGALEAMLAFNEAAHEEGDFVWAATSY